MRRSARRTPASCRLLPHLTSLLAAAAIAGCGADSSGVTGPDCFISCSRGSGPDYPYPDAPIRNTPTAVAGGQTFTAVSAGVAHACALTPAGAAQCWGEWDLGTSGYRTVPAPERVPGGVAFATLSAGGAFTCGVAADARTFCWGINGYGELGVGGISGPPTWPTPVSGGHTFVGVATGAGYISAGAHACAVDVAGAAYCWGSNSFGQLGTGNAASATAPVAVTGGQTFASLSAGNGFSCGVTTTGAAYCWGLGAQGQLGAGAAALGSCTGKLAGGGDASYTAACSRTPVRVAGDVAFTAVAAGMFHACGLADGGAAYCWGSSGFGGTFGNQPIPVGVGARFTRIAAGGASTCALTADGEAYCWGENTRGQLGDGTTDHSAAPTPVATALRFVGISVGYDFACAVTAEGAAYCWGSDEHGKLGDGA